MSDSMISYDSAIPPYLRMIIQGFVPGRSKIAPWFGLTPCGHCFLFSFGTNSGRTFYW